MFPISKRRGDSDLCLCTTSVLASAEPLRHDKIRFFLRRKCFFFGSRHCASVLQMQVPKLCTDLDFSLLHILILGTYSKFTRKNNFLALGVCFLQPCSSAGRVKITYFSNERGFSVESSLQLISSKFLLWKRNDSSVVLYT